MFTALLATLVAVTSTTSTMTSTVSPPKYPARGALSRLDVSFPKNFGKRRIYLDAGHGHPGNEGASTAFCEREEDVVLRIARGVAAHLEASGHFIVRLSRNGTDGPYYDRRLRDAERFRADVLLSIHLDARGWASLEPPPDAPELACPRNDEQPGFGVLLSDRRGGPLVERRLKLARSLASRLAQVGLPPYDGYDYGTLYELDPTPGVFLDRRGLFMLRRPAIPSVIIETHHGLHLDEALRWKEPETIEAFASAVAAALVDALARR